MEDFYQTLGGLRFARADLRVLAEHMEFDLAFDDLHQQTVNGTPAVETRWLPGRRR